MVLEMVSFDITWQQYIIDSVPCLTLDIMGASHLLSIKQTKFTIDAQPTCRGHAHQTRDMVEVTTCICGIPVDIASRIVDTAI